MVSVHLMWRTNHDIHFHFHLYTYWVIFLKLFDFGPPCPCYYARGGGPEIAWIDELQWLDLKIGHQDNSPSNNHQSDMSYIEKKLQLDIRLTPVLHTISVTDVE